MKKLISVLLLAAMLCSLAACGASGKRASGRKGESIDLKEIVTTDCCEFFVDSFSITDDVVPPAASGNWKDYKAEDGKTYEDFCISYKNRGLSDVALEDAISGTLLYANRYKYTGFSFTEKNQRSDFTYSNSGIKIAPRGMEYIHYLFALPKEAENSTAEILLEMTIGGKRYQFVGREETGTPVVARRYGAEKRSGSVERDEVISTSNAEFYINYSNIANRVIPLAAGQSYSYFGADSGKVFVDVCFAYRNMGTENIQADEAISAKIKYANKDVYTGFSMIECENRTRFTYADITSIAPLTTEYIHYLFEVPEEIAETTESIVVSFLIDGNLYDYTVR